MAVYTYVYTLNLNTPDLSMYQLAAAASGVATAPTVDAVIMHLWTSSPALHLENNRALRTTLVAPASTRCYRRRMTD